MLLDAPTRPRTRYPIWWLARERNIDPRSGQTVSFSRSAAGATATGIDGETISARPRDLPVWTWDTSLSQLALRLTSDDTFEIPWGPAPAACTLYLDFIFGSSAAGVLGLGATGARFVLDLSNARAEHDNDSEAAVTVPFTGGGGSAPSAGERVRATLTLAADGSFNFTSQIDDDDPIDHGDSSAPASGIVQTSAWPNLYVALTAGSIDLLEARLEI